MLLIDFRQVKKHLNRRKIDACLPSEDGLVRTSDSVSKFFLGKFLFLPELLEELTYFGCIHIQPPMKKLRLF